MEDLLKLFNSLVELCKRVGKSPPSPLPPSIPYYMIPYYEEVIVEAYVALLKEYGTVFTILIDGKPTEVLTLNVREAVDDIVESWIRDGREGSIVYATG